MKQSLLRLTFLISILIGGLSFDCRASHVIGGEITYACTATPGVFEVTMVFYRDCYGLTYCSGGCGTACSETIQISGAEPGCATTNFFTATLNLVNVRDMDMNTSQCPNSKNVCNNRGCITPGTYTPGRERYEFKGNIDIGTTSGIPSTCCNIRIWYSNERRSDINTGSASQGFYIDAVMNRCLSLSPCNSSPTFKNEAVSVICGDQLFYFNNEIIDPEGDSLSIAFAPALSNYNTSVSYLPPFAYDKPMPWTGFASDAFPRGIHCDPINGDITFSAPPLANVFNGVVAIEVKQWKKINGIPTLIGIVRRDVEMTLTGYCLPNNAPTIQTTPPSENDPNQPKTDYQICAGNQLCFTVNAKDPDYTPPSISDTTYLSWNSTLALLGASFLPDYTTLRTLNGPREDRYQFCWTPHDSTVRNQPYFFSVSAKDNKCPKPGRITRAFSIKVFPRHNVVITHTNKNCDKIQVGYINNDPSMTIMSSILQISKTPNDFTFANGSFTYNNVSLSPDLTFTQPGKYLVKLNVHNGNCPTELYDTLIVDTPFTLITRDTIVCAGSQINLNALAISRKTPLSYKWFRTAADTLTTPLNSPNFNTPMFPVTINNAENFYLVVKDSSGCSAHANLSANIIKPIRSIDIRDLSCFGSNNGTLTVHLKDSSPSYQYRLDSGSFQSSNVFNNLAVGSYAVTVKDSANCKSSQTIQIQQPDLLKDTLITVKDESCAGMNNGSFAVHATGGTKPYKFGLDSIVFKPDTLYSSLVPRSYTMHIFDSNNCYVKLTRTIAAADSLHYTTILKNPLCAKSANGEIKISASGGKKPYLFKLDNNPFTADSIHRNLLAKNYTITIRDANGCEVLFQQLLTAPDSLWGTVAVQDVNCFGTATGSALAQGGGGTPPYQYRMIGYGSGLFNTTGDFQNISALYHTFEIRDSLNCSAFIPKLVNQPPAITPVITTQPASCFENMDGKLSIQTSGGLKPYRFSLDSINFGTDSVMTNLASGSYPIYILDSLNCLVKTNTTITKPAKVSATTTLTSVSCFGKSDGKIIITPISGKTPFTFSLDGNPFSASNIFNNLNANNYSIFLKDSSGCRDTIHTMITAPPALQGTATANHVSCFGEHTGRVTISGSGGVPPYQYRSTGSGTFNTSGIFPNLSAASYSFEIKDSMNCTEIISQSINQPASILATSVTSTATSCFENTDGAISIHTTGGVKPYRFSLDSVSFQTDSVISNLANGAYSVYILDSVACSKKIPATITAPVKVSATALITPVSCFGRTDGKITITPVAGKTPFMFSLNGNAFVAGNAFSNLGATTHAVIVKDSIGCRDTIHAVITAPAPIVIGSITGPNTSPVNVSETYSIAPQPGLSYKWTALKGIVTSDDTSATAIIRWDTTGVGRVGVALYKDTACGDTTSMLVTIGTSGLSELARSWGLSIYPNPAKSILNINLEKLPQHQTIQLLDVQGKLMLQQELKLSQQLDLEKLTTGIYILKIGEWSGQVVKE